MSFKDPEKARAYRLKWDKENLEKRRATDKKWSEANPEKRRGYCQKWRTANPEKARAASRNWSKANIEKVRENAVKWDLLNPGVRGKNAATWAKENVGRKRATDVLHKYNLDAQAHLTLLEKQNFLCALHKLCGRSVNLSSPVDHDHATNHVRGILCSPHNTGLGGLGDTIEGLEIALEYLKRAKAEYEALQANALVLD